MIFVLLFFKYIKKGYQMIKRDNFNYKRIRDFLKISMCKRVFKNQTNSIKGIPFFKIGTIGTKEDSYISEELFELLKNKYRYPKKGEILLTCSGTIGNVYKFDGKNAYFQDSNIV